MKSHAKSENLERVEETSRPLYSFWIGALIVKGSAFPRVIWDVIAFGVLSVMVVVLSRLTEDWYHFSLAIPVFPFEAAGAVLGLLLVLRLNSGYERWWEARKLWGGIVNQSRNIAIAALAYGPPNANWRDDFVRWTASFPHVTRRSLRGERKLLELKHLIGEDQVESLAKNEHLPNAVSTKLAQLLQQARQEGLDDWAFYQIEQQRSLLIDHLGGCERILKTPLALSSAIQVRRFILLFLGALPFALLKDFETEAGTFVLAGHIISARIWLLPLFVMMVAYPLLSLDRIGMELQNPFSRERLDHLPLDNICYTIEKNLLELLVHDPISRIQWPVYDSVQLPPDAKISSSANPLNRDIS